MSTLYNSFFVLKKSLYRKKITKKQEKINKNQKFCRVKEYHSRKVN